MDWKDIIKNTGIEVIWIDKEYTEEGSYIPKCSLYPNGAIVLNLAIHCDRIEFIALHEIGHLVSGKALTIVNNRIKAIAHTRNEALANRYVFRNIAPRYVEENQYDRTWASPHKLCEFLNIEATFENIGIAQEEIDIALGYNF